jgi:hypothetical protein
MRCLLVALVVRESLVSTNALRALPPPRLRTRPQAGSPQPRTPQPRWSRTLRSRRRSCAKGGRKIYLHRLGGAGGLRAGGGSCTVARPRSRACRLVCAGG